MTKVLRSSTIIPPALYVHRNADRQLRRVLEEMGRPGYVLVARQMGKTNLLLNARRELQEPSDAFVYVDLSNPFSSARECFRNIIDTALDSHSSSFSRAAPAITQIRQKDLPPHKEHELELRELLRAIEGKLVIILDEIDALTNSAFSDQIFAQIRSTYFSRANLLEYGRLTYVLSGVAEPSELIKNSKLSPFNIGEKIYLDDFTRMEFQQFLEKSHLGVTAEVASRIFEWTSGNPRITWDVCAELEDTLLDGKTITIASVDQAVTKLYLTSYDKAPIDHIRTLAETTPEIRSALVELRYGKGALISDSVRTKLYLAGIIASSGDNPQIKNKVIDLALSVQWLRDVERRKLGLLTLASEQLLRERYKDAIESYTEYLNKGAPSEEERLTAYNGLSEAHYLLGEYQAALEWIKKGRLDKSQMAGLYFVQTYREAICHFHTHQYEKSIACFNEIISWGQDKKLYYQAILNLASTYFTANFQAHRDTIFRLYNRVIEEIDSSDSFKPQEQRALKVVARYNLSKLHQQSKELESAIQVIEKALETAIEPERPILLYELSTLISDPERKLALLRTSVEIIIKENLKLSVSPSNLQLSLTESTLSGLLAATFEMDESGAFEKLFNFCINSDQSVGPTALAIPFDLLLSAMTSKGPAAVRKITARIVDTASAAGDDATLFLGTKFLAYYSQNQRDFAPYASKYIELLKKQTKSRALDPQDYTLISSLLSAKIREGKLYEADRILEFVDTYRPLKPPESFLAFDYYAMIVSDLSGDREEAIRLAQMILQTIGSAKTAPNLSPGDLEILQTEAKSMINSPIRPAKLIEEGRQEGRKYQRNEKVTVRYADGMIITTKYKKIENDLHAGRCEIIESP